MPADISDFYPPNPTNVPRNLAKPSLRYRLQALVVAACLLLFVAVYLALIVAFAAVAFWSWDVIGHATDLDDWQAGSATLLITLAGFLGCSCPLLALYFIKGLFKFPKGDDHKGLEITEAEHPRLFAFIRQICADTGAPPPAKIVLSPEVNAGVFYTPTFWNLFLPTRKNLHIGLGLVNALELSEFKAVLAHEFGHFSQRTMRLGGYVYSSNRIVGEIIFGRDWLDEALSAFNPVLNAIRWFLGKLFRVINFADAGLSRQMEFQADLVAVSVCGSDAIIHGLLRTDFAQQCLDHTWQDLTAAGDHGIWTRDVFHHQTKTADYLRVLKDDPMLGLPPLATAGAARPVFPPNETVLPPMWASHPPHYQREENCKRNYVAGPRDDRSAWLLFEQPEALRVRMTAHHYKLARPDQATKPRSADEVQQFIDADRAETIYSARYHGMYEEGLISPGEIDKLQKSIPSRWERAGKLLAEHTAIFSPELRERLVAYKARCQEQQRLQRFAKKVEFPKGGVFDFRGKKYRTAAAEQLLETLEKELSADHDYLAGIDRRIFLVYMGMSGQIDGKTSQDLEHRYRFHLAVQEMIISLTYWNRQIQDAFAVANSTRDASPESIQAVAVALREAQDAMGRHITLASTLRLPAFRNMQAGHPLSFFLDAKPVIHDLFGTEQFMNGTWINQILARHSEVIDKLRRILFKSLGSLLCFQERVGEQWKARYATGPTFESPVGAQSPDRASHPIEALPSIANQHATVAVGDTSTG